MSNTSQRLRKTYCYISKFCISCTSLQLTFHPLLMPFSHSKLDAGVRDALFRTLSPTVINSPLQREEKHHMKKQKEHVQNTFHWFYLLLH